MEVMGEQRIAATSTADAAKTCKAFNNGKMTIAFVTYEFPPDTGKGGIGTYTAQVAGLLSGMGAAVHVFAGTLSANNSTTENGYRVHRVQASDGNSFKTLVVPIFKTAHALRPFDIIECPEINSNAWYIRQEFPLIPLIVRLHAPDYLVESLKKTYYSFFTKLRFALGALRRGKIDLGFWRSYNYSKDPDYRFTLSADAVSTPSITMKNWVVKNWKILPGKIAVISNPFTPSKAMLAISSDNQKDRKQIIFFGRLNVLKGLVNATYAMKRILHDYPQSDFIVVGNDAEGPKPNISMKRWMQQQLNTSIDRVHFYKGFDYEKLPDILREASIVLLPSLFESFSYTCAEAMAAGKAVIGSKNTGMEDLMENEKTGILINPYSVRQIYDSLRRLLDQPEICAAIGKAAREAIEIKCNSETLGKATLDFYKATIEKSNDKSYSFSQ
jgi:glycosyltransferase involved in cell wall biosynthesis